MASALADKATEDILIIKTNFFFKSDSCCLEHKTLMTAKHNLSNFLCHRTFLNAFELPEYASLPVFGVFYTYSK